MAADPSTETKEDVAMDDDGWGDDDGFDDDVPAGEGWDDDEEMLLDPAGGAMYIESAPPLHRSRTQMRSLGGDDIDDAIALRITQLKESIELDEDKCLLLLRKFKWNVAKVIEAYFVDPAKVQKDAGICAVKATDVVSDEEIECQVCMDDFPADEMFHLDCGHQTTCSTCWTDYLRRSVKSKDCVSLVCPAFKCDVVVPETAWHKFLAGVDDTALERYVRFCRENFVEFSKDFGFCPGKSCDRVFHASAGVAKEVACDKCEHRFCWACKQESHFPASCHIAEKWLMKCSSESENLGWILAKTKKCPRCGVHIEKNQGCNHMTCRKDAGGCGHEFCWLCKGDWTTHGSATGGYYQCNIYEKAKGEGKTTDEELKQSEAENELQRYEFHWTRYDSHIKSSQHAMKQKSATHEKMHELATKFQWRLNEAQFLLDAVNEAIQCWHVLAWTYPIAYYFEEEVEDASLLLFKEQQGTLEKFCNGLQAHLDFELDKLGQNKTRQEIIHYTRTSAQYRKNLVEHIESDIAI
jgi:ariadne-1